MKYIFLNFKLLQNNTFSTLFVGQNLIKLTEVDSTNSYMKHLLSNSEPLPEGTVIMAGHQTAGRGQQGAKWESDCGKNLTLSVYLKPKVVPLIKSFYLNMAVSLAVKDLLSWAIADAIRIKWPNDIYWKDKKLAGILIENTLTGSIIKSSVIGIGINVNQDFFTKAIADKAASIYQITKIRLDLIHVLSKLCGYLEKYYLLLLAGKYHILHKNYSDSLYLSGELTDFEENGQVFEGIIVGVEDSGLLVINTITNQLKFNAKEVKYLHTHKRNDT